MLGWWDGRGDIESLESVANLRPRIHRKLDCDAKVRLERQKLRKLSSESYKHHFEGRAFCSLNRPVHPCLRAFVHAAVSFWNTLSLYICVAICLFWFSSSERAVPQTLLSSVCPDPSTHLHSVTLSPSQSLFVFCLPDNLVCLSRCCIPST